MAALLDGFKGVLVQHFPTSTADFTLVSEESDTFITTISYVVICNTSAGAVTFNLYLGRNDGFGIGTALFYETAIAARTTREIDTGGGWALDTTRKLGGATSAINTLTFTVFGKRTTKSGV
jgi:hypothetical protein